jgi:hypothetical protein
MKRYLSPLYFTCCCNSYLTYMFLAVIVNTGVYSGFVIRLCTVIEWRNCLWHEFSSVLGTGNVDREGIL